MNNYFTLRKANRLRARLLSATSQQQLREVTRYLRRVTWDINGIELVRCDLIDIAVQANAEGNELFHKITDAETFVRSIKAELPPLSWLEFLSIAIPLFCFFGCGVEGLLLYPVVPEFRFTMSLGWMVQVCISTVSAYYLLRRVMERVGFPPKKHRVKYVVYLALYIVVLYKIGELLYNMLGGVVFAAIPILPFAIGNLILGGIVLAIRFYWYGKDERLTARL